MSAYGRGLSLLLLAIIIGASLMLAGAARRGRLQGQQDAANAPTGTAKPGEGIVRETLGNGLRVVIVPDKLAPVATTVVNYLVGSDEAPAGFPGNGARAGTHDVSREPGPFAGATGQYFRGHGREFRRGHAADRDAIFLHRPGRRSGRRAAHRGPAHARACSTPTLCGTRSAARSSRKWRRICRIRSMCFTPSC